MVIASYSKPEEAHLAASLLHGNGIDAFVRDEYTVNMHWLYSNAIGGVKVEVADEDFETAKEVLELPDTKEDALLLCPECESGNVNMRQLSLLSAISMSLYLPLPFACRKVDCLDCGKEFTHK